jgi:micrococcal nuclease
VAWPAPARVRSLSTGLVALGGLALGGVGACRHAPVQTAEPAVVEHVVDGDTIDVALGAQVERIRMIGIDTPETKIPDEAPECWGPEATALTEALLPVGTPVRLERDLEPRDDYGRLLAYVIRDADGLVVNVELARQGAAEPLRIRPNVAYAGSIAAAAEEARAAGRGLWGACQ